MNSRVSELAPVITFNEMCLLEFKLNNQDRLLFGCFYRSPTQSEMSDENNQKLNLLFKELATRNFTHICFVGDFNYKDINWKTCSTPHNETSKEAKFLDAIKDCYLHQHVLESTRARGNDDPSTIDLIFTNEIMQISNLEFHAPLGKSDHSMISFNFICYTDYQKPHKRFAYHKGDYEAMRNHLDSITWTENFLKNHEAVSNVEKIWISFKLMLHELRDRFVPKVSDTWKQKGNMPVPKEIREVIKNKQIAH